MRDPKWELAKALERAGKAEARAAAAESALELARAVEKQNTNYIDELRGKVSDLTVHLERAESALAEARGLLEWLALHAIVEEYATDSEAGEPEGDGEHYLVFVDVSGQRWSKRKYAKEANMTAARAALRAAGLLEVPR